MIRTLLRFNAGFFSGIILLFLSSCEVLDPQEQVPCYIYIDTIDLNTDYLTEGSTSSKFTDAWVYIDDEPLGAYELPATIPILKEGGHEVKIRGGIKLNGIAATRAPYIMCNFNTQYIDLQLDKIVTLSPTVSYFTALNFKWKEDFENAGVSLTNTSASDTSIQISTDPSKVFEGNQSGVVYLDANNPYFEAVSSSAYTLPLADVFLELNYKCNNPFSIGIYAAGNQTPYTTLFLNPSEQWNKIYINLANEIGALHSNPYNIFISMAKSESVDFPELYLDNIKLIHQ